MKTTDIPQRALDVLKGTTPETALTASQIAERLGANAKTVSEHLHALTKAQRVLRDYRYTNNIGAYWYYTRTSKRTGSKSRTPASRK